MRFTRSASTAVVVVPLLWLLLAGGCYSLRDDHDEQDAEAMLVGSGTVTAGGHSANYSAAPADWSWMPEGSIIAELDDPRYPSARACAACHPQHYEEWSVSPHAYAQLSPVFNAMHGRIVQLTNGTFGDFCIRCHTPVGMALDEPLLAATNLERHPTSREGITCIVCHRVRHEDGKLSGRMELSTGSVTASVVGPTGNKLLQSILEDPEGDFPGLLTTDPDEVLGVRVHGDVEQMTYLSQPGFCGACHDVTLKNGFRLEEAFSDYKTSPAARKGVTCQDCHMGSVPGKPEGIPSRPPPSSTTSRRPFASTPITCSRGRITRSSTNCSSRISGRMRSDSRTATRTGARSSTTRAGEPTPSSAACGNDCSG